jgi:putative two-component system response regulator
MTTAAPGAVTVLVVEDDRVQRLVLERALSVSAYNVVTAADAEEGLLAAQRHRPALIISDYYMPGMDGFAFCRAVRAHPDLADTMFVLLTAATETQRKLEGLDTGADDYLIKPVNAEELRSKVRALLRIHALHDELRRDRAELSRLNEALTQGLAGVVTLLTHLIGRRVPGALQRGERAAALARWIGTRAEMGEVGVRALELAARIHEIGKIDLPDALLAKSPAELTPDERDHLAQFPLIGSLLVQSIPQLEPVASWIRHQLENYDGSGIPDHLRGSQIPVGARILRLVNLVEEAEARGRHGSDLAATVDAAQGTALGPRLSRLALAYLETALDPGWMTGKRPLSVEALEPGMVIAADLCTGRGTKLLAKDSTLTRPVIDRILAFQRLDPILDEIYVYETPPVAAR